MNEIAWLSVPVGMDAGRWVTRDRYRTVLVAVHTMVAAQRLLDVVCAVETDLRVQVVFTQAPDVFHGGVDQLLHDLGALVLPWQQAVHERFDLVLAAAYTGLDQLHGPVMVLPHGAGYGKRAAGGSSRGVAAVYGLDAQRLVRDGHLVASSIVLSHTSQQRVLRRQCPAAVDAAVVAGDPCYDRLRASLLLRPLYRAAFDVAQDRQFVLVASTWGRQSLVGRNIELIARLMEQLDPRRYCVAALIHPAVWAGHGARQLRAWLQDAIGSGLTLIEPDVDWRAALLAADYVIGDHGSVTVYATSLGIPVLTTAPADDTLDPRSPQAWVSQHAPKLAVSEPLEPQLRQVTVAAARAGRAAVVRRLTSRPGESYRALREEMYRLLKLPILGKHRSPEPIAVRPSRRSSRHG